MWQLPWPSDNYLVLISTIYIHSSHKWIHQKSQTLTTTTTMMTIHTTNKPRRNNLSQVSLTTKCWLWFLFDNSNNDNNNTFLPTQTLNVHGQCQDYQHWIPASIVRHRKKNVTFGPLLFPVPLLLQKSNHKYFTIYA